MKYKFEVTVDDGKISPWGPVHLPKLRKAARATLVIEEEYIDDREFDARSNDFIEQHLDVSEGIVVRLAAAKGLAFDKYPFTNIGIGHPCVRVELDRPLVVRKRPGRASTLPSQLVKLPTLNSTVGSLNQACQKLSETYETERLTHTYSAFEVVFIKRNERWFPLKDLSL